MQIAVIQDNFARHKDTNKWPTKTAPAVLTLMRNYSYPRTRGQDQNNTHQILNLAYIFPDRSYYQVALTILCYISDRSWSFFPYTLSLENRGELYFTSVFNLLIITLQKTLHYLLFPFSSDHFLPTEIRQLLNVALLSGCSQSCWKQLTHSVRCQGEVQTSSTLLHKPRWTVQRGLIASLDLFAHRYD